MHQLTPPPPVVPDWPLLLQTESDWARENFLRSADAFLLLYSVTDRASFLRASELRISLRRFRPAQRTPIILVGNKCDLVRRREVSASGEAPRSASQRRTPPGRFLSDLPLLFDLSEGRTCAAVFDCKFIETSAAMQHNVWEAFRGIVRQLRLRRDSEEVKKRRRRRTCRARRESIPSKARRLLDKVVAKRSPGVAFWLKSKSCHDLSVL